MITEQDKLDLLLESMDADLIGCTVGTDPNTTVEQRARAIRKSIIALRRNEPGAFRDVDLSI